MEIRRMISNAAFRKSFITNQAHNLCSNLDESSQFILWKLSPSLAQTKEEDFNFLHQSLTKMFESKFTIASVAQNPLLFEYSSNKSKLQIGIPILTRIGWKPRNTGKFPNSVPLQVYDSFKILGDQIEFQQRKVCKSIRLSNSVKNGLKVQENKSENSLYWSNWALRNAWYFSCKIDSSVALFRSLSIVLNAPNRRVI